MPVGGIPAARQSRNDLFQVAALRYARRIGESLRVTMGIAQARVLRLGLTKRGE